MRLPAGLLFLFPSLRRLERRGTPAPCLWPVHSRVRVSGDVVQLREAAAHRIRFLRPYPLLGAVFDGGEGLGGVVSRRSVGSGELVPVVGVGVVEARCRAGLLSSGFSSAAVVSASPLAPLASS